MTWVTRTRTSVSQQARTERFDSDGNGSLDGSRSVVDQTTTTETYQEYVPSEQPGTGIDPGEGAVRKVSTQVRTDTFEDANRNGKVGPNEALLYSDFETSKRAAHRFCPCRCRQ
ncbi:hypothetical protein [Hyalangium sp.]|uniref:hypothetical protein n=1 Tax=Hyalangium sp. TaxID=2028555 RepID=UPI002D76175D|nr:hypothetical protein [Hyalangium sp.]HYH99615.1 hypothetical protein [Hyalangium sp.]